MGYYSLDVGIILSFSGTARMDHDREQLIHIGTLEIGEARRKEEEGGGGKRRKEEEERGGRRRKEEEGGGGRRYVYTQTNVHAH